MQGILGNLIASAIWVIAGATAYRWLLVPLRRRRNVLSRCLPFVARNEITVCYGLLPPRQGHVYYTVEEGDLAAITYADSNLVQLYGRKRVKTINFQSVEVRLSDIRNLLSISGPKWNRVTETLIGRLGSPILFDQTDALLVTRNSTGSQRQYRAVRRPNGDEEVCFGFVCAGQVFSPTGRKQNVVVCAGLNTLSTYGSVIYLMSLSRQYSFRSGPHISRRTVGKKWAVVLRVENISNPNTSGPVRRPVDPDQITIDVVETLGENDFAAPFTYRF